MRRGFLILMTKLARCRKASSCRNSQSTRRRCWSLWRSESRHTSASGISSSSTKFRNHHPEKFYAACWWISRKLELRNNISHKVTKFTQRHKEDDSLIVPLCLPLCFV